jgi:hypothetical protein
MFWSFSNSAASVGLLSFDQTWQNKKGRLTLELVAQKFKALAPSGLKSAQPESLCWLSPTLACFRKQPMERLRIRGHLVALAEPDFFGRTDERFRATTTDLAWCHGRGVIGGIWSLFPDWVLVAAVYHPVSIASVKPEVRPGLRKYLATRSWRI